MLQSKPELSGEFKVDLRKQNMYEMLNILWVKQTS